MADRIEVSKATATVALGIADTAQISKIVAYLLLVPGTEDGEPPERQAHVFSQILRRP